jgi:hypothetical protein
VRQLMNLYRHTHACLVPHCPSLALTELTAVVAADANDWDSVCTLAQLILQVHFSHGCFIVNVR